MLEGDNTATKLSVTLPSLIWIAVLSRKFPDNIFEFRSAMMTDNVEMATNNLFSIKGINPSKCLQVMKTFSEINLITLLEEKPHYIALMVQSKNHFILHAMQKYHIVPQFPIIIQNGIATIEIVGCRSHIDEFIDELQSKQMNVEIHQMGAYKRNPTLNELSPRQLEIYQKAKKAGYYETPRRITLTQLAKQENLSKSTLSILLQKVHKKLLGESNLIR